MRVITRMLIIAAGIATLAAAAAPAGGRVLGERDRGAALSIDVGVRADWNGFLLRGSLTLDRGEGKPHQPEDGAVSGTPPDREAAAVVVAGLPLRVETYVTVCRAVRRALILALRQGTRAVLQKTKSSEGR
jgi:hypothetical protein